MSKRATIRCGNRVLGSVAIFTCDNFHIYGSFAPGADFAFYEHAIFAFRGLEREADSNPDVDSSDALEIVNAFGFSLSNDDGTFTPIRDFQLGDDGVAVFKLDM